jgi:hypothetical protein
MTEGVDQALSYPADALTFRSPPDVGPFSVANDNPLYNGGVGMMDLIATGIYDGALSVETAMTDALVNSFQFAMGKYEEEAARSLSVSTVMAQVADQVIRNLTGVGRVTLTAEEKQVLKASLDIPGLAGVAGAILADGNLTRKYLDRIAVATEGIYEKMGGPAKGGGGKAPALAAQ